MNIEVAGVVLTFDWEEYKGDWTEDRWAPILAMDKAKSVEGPFVNGVVAVTFELERGTTGEIAELKEKLQQVLENSDGV